MLLVHFPFMLSPPAAPILAPVLKNRIICLFHLVHSVVVGFNMLKPRKYHLREDVLRPFSSDMYHCNLWLFLLEWSHPFVS